MHNSSFLVPSLALSNASFLSVWANRISIATSYRIVLVRSRLPTYEQVFQLFLCNHSGSLDLYLFLNVTSINVHLTHSSILLALYLRFLSNMGHSPYQSFAQSIVIFFGSVSTISIILRLWSRKLTKNFGCGKLPSQENKPSSSGKTKD